MKQDYMTSALTQGLRPRLITLLATARNKGSQVA